MILHQLDDRADSYQLSDQARLEISCPGDLPTTGRTGVWVLLEMKLTMLQE